MNKTYKLELNYYNGTTEILEITTDRLEWSIDQIGRNREPFQVKIIE
jgi:hypothetical protein